MNQGNSIKLKALVLFTVFSLNTVMGFACSLGLEMGFNATHHENGAPPHHHDEATPPHHHDINTPPHHHAKPTGSHHHSEAENQHQHSSGKTGEKDNCCSDNVIKFEQLDKSVSGTVKLNLNTIFFTSLVHIFCLDDILSPSQVTGDLSLVRWCFPPSPDIRVSIQSFQI